MFKRCITRLILICSDNHLLTHCGESSCVQKHFFSCVNMNIVANRSKGIMVSPLRNS